MTFGVHSFQILIKDIAQARQVDLINKPDRREDTQGAPYTPTVVTLDCGDEKIHVYLEDVKQVIQTLSGVKLVMLNNEEIKFTCV